MFVSSQGKSDNKLSLGAHINTTNSSQQILKYFPVMYPVLPSVGSMKKTFEERCKDTNVTQRAVFDTYVTGLTLVQ